MPFRMLGIVAKHESIIYRGQCLSVQPRICVEQSPCAATLALILPNHNAVGALVRCDARPSLSHSKAWSCFIETALTSTELGIEESKLS